MSYVNPSRTTVFIQTKVGEPLKPLPSQSVVTAPSGKGFSFESDFASRHYQGTRFTGNQSRVTFNLQSRRDALISILRDVIGDGQNLFNIIVLESDTEYKPGFDNFTVGSIFRDCGLTGRSTSASLSDTTGLADPKQMDVMALSAGDWQEIRPLVNSSNLLTGASLPAEFLGRGIHYAESVLTAQGSTEITVILGYDNITGAPYLYYTYSKGQGVWSALTTTGLPASVQVYTAVILNNRMVIGTSQGIYHSSLINLPGTVWFLANGTTTSDVVSDIISPDPGLIIGIDGNTAGEYLYSYDGGFSFTRVLTTVGDTFLSIAGISPDLVWIGTNDAIMVRVKSQTRWDSMSAGGLVGGEDIRAVAVPPGRLNEVYFGTSTGRIFRSQNATARTPTWEEILYPKTSSSSPTINFLKFSPDGLTLWIGFTTATARLLVDYSGGSGGIACGTPNGGFGCDNDLYVYSNVLGLSLDDQRVILTE